MKNKQIQPKDHEYNQEHLRQASVPVPQSGGNALGFHDFHQHFYDGDSNIPINIPSGRSTRKPITKGISIPYIPDIPNHSQEFPNISKYFKTFRIKDDFITLITIW